jgi:hypothetical protein
MFEKINSWKYAAIIFIIVSILFCYPIYSQLNNWGIHDWDQHLFYEGAARISLLTYHQFPLWNPWQCGGNVLLANPQSPFLSIHFPFTLLLGEVLATKLAISLYLFIGLLGMWFTAQKLNIKGIASYFPPILLMLSGIYAIRMTVGHTNWYHCAWVPWIFFFYLKSKEHFVNILPASFFLAVIFLSGGIHPFVIAVCILSVYAIVTAMHERQWKPLLAVFFIFLLWMPFAAVKLVPMLSVYNEMQPIEPNDVQPISFKIIFDSLTNRTPELSTMYGNFWQLHEYYAYIGIIAVILFLFSCILFRKYWQYHVPALAVLVCIFLAEYLPLPSFFHGPSRFIFAFLFFVSLCIGFLMQHVQEKQQTYMQVIMLILLSIIVIDLLLVNTSILSQAFTVESQQTQSTEYYTIYAENDEMNYMQYQSLLENHGVWNCYERFMPNIAARPKLSFSGIEYGDYHGEAYLSSTNEQQTITYFSPNKIIVHSNAGLLILNQNYISGWKVEINNENAEVLNTNGLISIPVTEESNVTFYYLPTAFIVGLIITMLSLFSWLFLWLRIK